MHVTHIYTHMHVPLYAVKKKKKKNMNGGDPLFFASGLSDICLFITNF